mmetsp:Transcript_29156/g.94048  ORF Transcript_29156/g.94048 Transcript_29156/m.94048 type:complete len:236 (-) Transcript_29156:209-916(-)
MPRRRRSRRSSHRRPSPRSKNLPQAANGRRPDRGEGRACPAAGEGRPEEVSRHVERSGYDRELGPGWSALPRGGQAFAGRRGLRQVRRGHAGRDVGGLFCKGRRGPGGYLAVRRVRRLRTRGGTLLRSCRLGPRGLLVLPDRRTRRRPRPLQGRPRPPLSRHRGPDGEPESTNLLPLKGRGPRGYRFEIRLRRQALPGPRPRRDRVKFDAPQRDPPLLPGRPLPSRRRSFRRRQG